MSFLRRVELILVSIERNNKILCCIITRFSHHVQDEGAAATSDADSALGEDVASSTASLASSILQYRKIRGRTYHSEIGNAQYWGANDDRHSESLDMLHHLFLLSFDDKLYLAPVTNPKVGRQHPRRVAIHSPVALKLTRMNSP
ncbi:hypothetical protein VTK73DRAFT_1483 [Phialemonium thermophilum]|uniref:Uncharacterized protein n=1 Tax=Phialemonium thermophilum TaxID=223376 RepID=A0ABR3VTG9_9PEZI